MVMNNNYLVYIWELWLMWSQNLLAAQFGSDLFESNITLFYAKQ